MFLHKNHVFTKNLVFTKNHICALTKKHVFTKTTFFTKNPKSIDLMDGLIPDLTWFLLLLLEGSKKMSFCHKYHKGKVKTT